MRVLRYSFNSMCVITLFCMAGYWIWKFAIDDRDIGIVDYIELGKDMDIELLSLTFCSYVFSSSGPWYEVVHASSPCNPV